MYLLMMLATFISAIYGYNLTARPDFDRDIVRKKAASMLYRFTYQASVVNKMISKIEVYNALGSEPYPNGILPGDEIYAAGDTSVTYKQGEGEHTFSVQGKNSLHFLPEGRDLYPSTEMRSRVYCLPYNSATHKFYDLNDYDGNYSANSETGDEAPSATQCSPSVNEEGKSCCQSNSHRYLITFRKIDVRWINRLTNDVNYDFQRALIKYAFSENIGYIFWDSNDSSWHFNGKIKLLPAYINDLRAWEEAHKHEADIEKRQFPAKLRNKTSWVLPKNFFTEDFFDVGGAHYCADGCLIKIRQI